MVVLKAVKVGRFMIAGVLAAAAGLASPAASADTTSIGLIEIERSPRERESPMAAIFGSDGSTSMRDLLGLFRKAAGNAEMKGLVVRLRDPEIQATQVEELGKVMDEVRAAGKKIHIFADGYSTTELLLASHADEVIVQSGGDVTVPGLYMEEKYMADTLNWVGIQPDFVQVGDYKGASEPMARNSPSPQWEQNINGLLDGMYGNIREAIKTGRKLTDDQLDAAMAKAFMANGATGKELRLIDAEVDLPDLTDHLEKSYGTDIDWTNYNGGEGDKIHMDISNPFSLMSKLMRAPDNTPKRDTIAVLHIAGPIVDGESQSGGFMGEESVGSATIRRALEEIESHDQIKGVVIRIDSPGGSAIASESIWLGVKRLSKSRPVWVSVGSMAASGGYYVAVAGQKVYVNPSSIVGSIGVVGGKLAMQGLYDKVKLRVVARSRGPLGTVLGSAAPWSETERGLIRTRMTETYDLFTRRVTAGRPGINLAATAEGRLFTGNVAVTNSMADKIGGLDQAIEDMAGELSLADGSYDVMDYPPAPGLGEILGGLFEQMASAPGAGGDSANTTSPKMLIGLLKEVVGPDAWPQVRDQFSAIMQMRKEPVLLVSPRAIIVK